MRTFNFATTIRRVFAIGINRAAVVTGKRSSHKPCCWQACHAHYACQAALRFLRRLVGVARRDRDLMPLSMSLGRLQPCSVATRRVCVEPVERSS